MFLTIFPLSNPFQSPNQTKQTNKNRGAEDYFQMRVYCEDYEGFLATHPAVIAIEPHDILPISLFVFSDYLGYFPTHTIRGCLTSAVFQIPGMRHVYSWASATSVSKRNIQRLLRKGVSTTICPGGAQEVTYMTSPHSKEITLYLKSRLGMIKLAAEFGAPIIPSFTFNQRKTFDFWVPANRYLHKLGKKLGFIPLVIFGLWGIPFAQAKPVAMTMVIGKAIPVRKMTIEELKDKQNEPELQAIANQVIEAMEQIFETHKEACDMGDFRLIIK